MLCSEEMPFLSTRGSSCECWVRLVRLWALAGVVEFFLGLPLEKRKRKERNLGKRNSREFGSSLNPGWRGAKLFVGCPTGLCKELQNQQDPGLSSGTVGSQAVQPLSLLHLSNENKRCSHIPALFWRWNGIIYGKNLAHWSVLSKMVMSFPF